MARRLTGTGWEREEEPLIYADGTGAGWWRNCTFEISDLKRKKGSRLDLDPRFALTKCGYSASLAPMPRQVHIQYPGASYHVMSRGNRRQNIYLDDVERHDFLKTLACGEMEECIA